MATKLEMAREKIRTCAKLTKEENALLREIEEEKAHSIFAEGVT